MLHRFPSDQIIEETKFIKSLKTVEHKNFNKNLTGFSAKYQERRNGSIGQGLVTSQVS